MHDTQSERLGDVVHVDVKQHDYNFQKYSPAHSIHFWNLCKDIIIHET